MLLLSVPGQGCVKQTAQQPPETSGEATDRGYREPNALSVESTGESEWKVEIEGEAGLESVTVQVQWYEGERPPTVGGGPDNCGKWKGCTHCHTSYWYEGKRSFASACSVADVVVSTFCTVQIPLSERQFPSDLVWHEVGHVVIGVRDEPRLIAALLGVACSEAASTFSEWLEEVGLQHEAYDAATQHGRAAAVRSGAD